MQLSSTPMPAAGLASIPQVGIQVQHPTLDPILARQQRYRIVGDGPLSQRDVVPATMSAAIASSRDGRPIEAVRSVLRLVEQVAGGAERSAGVDLNGISFADSHHGLAANSYRAQLDDNVELQRAWSGHGRGRMERNAAEIGQQMVAETRGAHANVVSGWLNLGPGASATMLETGAPSARGRADAVRVLAHEAVHVVDPSHAGLAGSADLAFVEARAEARSTSIPQLQAARRALGFDRVVGDSDLAASLSIRPYAAAERLLAQARDAAGIAPGTPDAATIEGLSNADALARLVERASARSGWSHDGVLDALQGAFAAAIPASG